jgi:peptidoglycan/xylan/chitin deacetylase (PgdA/CDA1 family)
MKWADDTAVERASGGHPWSPAPAVWFSILVYAAALGAVVVQPALWPCVLGAVAVNHALLFAAVFLPRSRLLGANLARLPAPAAARREVCLTFDDGLDPEVTPRVLDLLDRYQAKASFFCVGEKAAAGPEIVRDIARRGHSIGNHSHRHSHAFAFYGIFRLRRDLESAQAVLAGLTGRVPRYFRAPVGLRSPLVDPVLARCGMTYVSWTRRGLDTIDRDPHRVLARLSRGLAAGDILVLHEKGTARTRDGTPVVLAVLPEFLNRLRAMGLRPVTLDAASNGT